MIYTAKAHIPYASLYDVIKIKPIADVHLGNALCDKRAFKAYLDDRDDKTWFIGNGDILDCIITTDQKRYNKTMDGSGPDIVDDQIAEAAKLLWPIKDRILGLGEGNHERTIANRCGTNPAKRLAQLLSTNYLGYSWLFRVMLSNNGCKGRTVYIRGHHGWGGGSRTQGGDLTKFSKEVAHWDADIFLYGHCHRLQQDKIARLCMVGDKLINKPKFICLTGTFQKTFSDNEYASYAEVSGFPPMETGGLTINIKPTDKHYKIWISI